MAKREVKSSSESTGRQPYANLAHLTTFFCNVKILVLFVVEISMHVGLTCQRIQELMNGPLTFPRIDESNVACFV